jgi:hypothetical protein
MRIRARKVEIIYWNEKMSGRYTLENFNVFSPNTAYDDLSV